VVGSQCLFEEGNAMKYDRVFLDKCLKLISDIQSGIPSDDMRSRLATLYSTHCKNGDVILEYLEDPESANVSERAGAKSLEALQSWEEGFQMLHDYSDHNDAGLLEEAQVCFKRGNDDFNQAQALYLDASEEDEIKFVM
jgi:hypothetical protein